MSEKFYEHRAAEVIRRGMVGFEQVRKENGHLRQMSATANFDSVLVQDRCILSFMCLGKMSPRSLYQLHEGFDIAR